MKKSYLFMLLLSCLLFIASYTTCNVIAVYEKQKATAEGQFGYLVEEDWMFRGVVIFFFGLTVLIITLGFWLENRK